MLDRFIGQIGGEVIVLSSDIRKDLRVIAEEIRRPLISFAAHEAVEILKPHSRWPLIIRPGDAVLIGGRVVVLAKPRRRITVLLQNIPNGSVLDSDDGVVAWVTGGEFADYPGADGVMVATGDQ